MVKTFLFVVILMSIPQLQAETCEDSLRGPVSALDWIELEALITAPVTTDSVEHLSQVLARHVPESPKVRAAATLEVYSVLDLGTPLYARLQYDQSSQNFAHDLIRKLASHQALQKRDRGGSALLIDWINAGVHMEALGEENLKFLDEKDKQSFLRLLDERSRDPDFDFDEDRKGKFVLLLAEALPFSIEARQKVIREIFGEDLSRRLLDSSASQPSYAIIEKLLQLLQTQATSLASKDDQLQKLFESAY